MNNLIPWKCKNGHVLGQSGRTGRGIRQVIIYREAMDPARLKEAPDVMLVAEGLVMDVRCSICGELRPWEPGEEAIRRILDLYKGGPSTSSGTELINTTGELNYER